MNYQHEDGSIGRREPNRVDEWLVRILNTGVRYTEGSSADELKDMIDDILIMVQDARNCLWDGKLFGIYGSPEEQQSTNNIPVFGDGPDCYDCKLYMAGCEDGTCLRYVRNTCPYGYHR